MSKKHPDHDHTIKKNASGRIVVDCDKGTPCRAQHTTQTWLNRGQVQDRSKEQRRSN